MVKSTSGNKSGYRSFSVVGAKKHGGCDTKFKGGRYISKTPVGAARKAFNALCRVKKIRGVCTLHVMVKDTTRDSKTSGKVYTYKLQRKKLSKPLVMMKGTDNEYKIEYTIVAKSQKGKEMPECKDKKQSRGPMSKRTKRVSGQVLRRSKRLANKKN